MTGQNSSLAKNRSLRSPSPAALGDLNPSLARVQLSLRLAGLTTGIVAAYVQKHFVPTAELANLIAGVHGALDNTQAQHATVDRPSLQKQKPFVSVQKSVTDEFIICLEDGERFKSMKRHLGSKYDMSPDEYRAKWGLADDYPMVAPAYAEKRSQLAREHRLGRKPSRKPAPGASQMPQSGA